MTTQTASVSKDTGLADPINLFLPILYIKQVATLSHHARAGACTVRAVPSGQLSGPRRNHEARVHLRPSNQTMHLVISVAVDRWLRKRCDPAPAQPGETGPAEPTRSSAVMPEGGECLWYAPRPALTPGVRDLAASSRPRKDLVRLYIRIIVFRNGDREPLRCRLPRIVAGPGVCPINRRIYLNGRNPAMACPFCTPEPPSRNV